MSLDNIRVNELAKELNLTNKEVLDKFAQLSIPIKTHSSMVTADQIQKLKNFIAAGSKIEIKKPKAFIVKKIKAEKEGFIFEEQEKSKEQEIEVIKSPVNKLEIVRKAPRPNPESVKHQRDFPQNSEKNFFKPQTSTTSNKNLKNNQEKTFNIRSTEIKKSPEVKTAEVKSDKKPIQRHIISQDIYDNKGGIKRKVEKKKEKIFTSKEEDQERISLEKAATQKHKKKNAKGEFIEQISKIVVNRPLTISELSEKIRKTPAEIVKFLMMQGVMATVNQLIDIDTIKKVCTEFELEVLDEDLDAFMEEELAKEEKNKALLSVDKKLLKHRAPVVSIMGHVDHGKTTLLDSIRASKHKIVTTEVGGITQSIGAYTVHVDKKKIVFIDTPGHEAFTEMRARGAKATDIAILVVAADDGIMPQTIEAINHAKAAETPIIVAVNKIDKAGANPDKVLQQLTEHALVAEEWGGETIIVKVSALQGTGIDELLEYILLLAEMADLKANPKAQASGVVIEANLDKGKGPVATLLVQNGTLRVGNCLVVGNVSGRVRALLSDEGERVIKAEPSTPVEILGLTEVPSAGDYFEVVGNEKEMKFIVEKRKEKERTRRLDAMLPAHIRKESAVGDGSLVQLNLIIKANTNGSAEAVSQAVAQLESKEIASKIIHVGVGDISEADVMLASASGAIILGFGVKEDSNAVSAVEREGVVIKKYDIIYQILEDLEKQMLSLLQPEIKHVELGQAEVRQIFTIGKTTKIAGCSVTEGKIQRGKTAIVIREGREIFKGVIDQLKRFKDDVKEVSQGFECGISFAKFNDLQEGDIIKVSTTEEVERIALS
jgi:translation initiation factor IF-2